MNGDPKRTADQGLPEGAGDEYRPAAAGKAIDVETLQAEIASLRDRMLRALADAENTRRRSERAAAEARRHAVADFARELLAIADNLQRAIAAAESQAAETTADTPLIEGIRATERMLMASLERFGIRKIEALGARFDPTLHEAVMEAADSTLPPGTIVEVLEEGYTVDGRLLRPARVIVAKGSPSQSSSES